MVKNVKGGSGHKGQARKHVNASRSFQQTRLSSNDSEFYAQVTGLLGNGMCNIQDVDGVVYLCIIRGKFRGRGKRDNTLNRDTWILAGRREFETVDGNKLPKCDLLEVYNDRDKEKLKSMSNVSWNGFIEKENENMRAKDSNDLEFVNVSEHQEEYTKMMEDELNNTNNKILVRGVGDEKLDDEVDIDDI